MPSRVLAIGLAFMCLAGNIQPARLAARAPLRQPGPSPRPSQTMFQSEPGTPRAIELQFDRQTGVVTITLSVEDPDGYFIPNLRPENFAVYQDGVPQTNATVDIDHAAVSLFVLLEGGGRYQELNNFLNIEIPSILHPLLDALVSNDKTAMLSYAHGVKVLADLGSPRDQLLSVITHPQISGFSEANLYDALRDTLARTGYPSGRRALLLISTGIDSVSHT